MQRSERKQAHRGAHFHGDGHFIGLLHDHDISCLVCGLSEREVYGAGEGGARAGGQVLLVCWTSMR
jgi:hypothetical protein